MGRYSSRARGYSDPMGRQARLTAAGIKKQLQEASDRHRDHALAGDDMARAGEELAAAVDRISLTPSMNAESQLCLRDGRRVDISRVEIAHSMAGFLEGDPARIWDIVLKESSRAAYVVTPVSIRADRNWLPEWRVCVELESAPIDSHHDVSSMTLVLFCSDIAGASVPELVSAELAVLSEEVWKDHSRDWDYG